MLPSRVSSRYNPKKRQFLFDLKNDPDENNNITDTVILDKMEEILSRIVKNYEFLDDGQTIENSNNSDTEKINNVLKKLGYI